VGLALKVKYELCGYKLRVETAKFQVKGSCDVSLIPKKLKKNVHEKLIHGKKSD
jgi:hypothetical protein